MSTRTTIIASVIAGAVVIAGVGATVAIVSSGTPSTSTSSPAPSSPVSPSPQSPSPTPTSASPTEPTAEAAPVDTATALRYLIEEEKLAHDVYVTLANTWGSGIFTNIADSEVSHQEWLVPLLADRGLVDPRSPEVGVFTDPTLQALYTELVTRGTASLADAIQVGVVIEEKDIVDLNAAIAAEDDSDVVSVLQRLLAGSENHLRAFQRQA